VNQVRETSKNQVARVDAQISGNRGNFCFIFYFDSVSTQNLRTSFVSAATPSPKRLRFQLPLNANVTSSSDDGSPGSEEDHLFHYEFGTPKASTPKSSTF
jgi:hypothetical protein